MAGRIHLEIVLQCMPVNLFTGRDQLAQQGFNMFRGEPERHDGVQLAALVYDKQIRGVIHSVLAIGTPVLLIHHSKLFGGMIYLLLCTSESHQPGTEIVQVLS